MRKKCVLIIAAIAILLCSCNKKDDNGNCFGGEGDIKGSTLSGCFYDDSGIYFANDNHMCSYSESKGVRYLCDNIACDHSTEECSAYIGRNHYFFFNGQLYVIENYESDFSKVFLVKNNNDRELMFTNKPADVPDAKPSGTYIYALNDEYMCTRSGYGTYLMDKDFNIIFKYDASEFQEHGEIYNDKYYYTDKTRKLNEYDLKTASSQCVDKIKDNRVLSFTFIDDNMFYTDIYSNLIKMNMNDYSYKVIMKEEAYLLLKRDNTMIITNDKFRKFFIVNEDGDTLFTKDKEIVFTEDNSICIDKKITCFCGEEIVTINTDGTDYTEVQL